MTLPRQMALGKLASEQHRMRSDIAERLAHSRQVLFAAARGESLEEIVLQRRPDVAQVDDEMLAAGDGFHIGRP